MIAMGMLVDNGIVIAEGMVVGVRRGLTPKNAAIQSVSRTQYPLLGATIIGILAFAPISLSDDNSGHFLVSLFQVVAISLLLSWLLAVTIVPLLGNILLKSAEPVSEGQLYDAWYFKAYSDPDWLRAAPRMAHHNHDRRYYRCGPIFNDIRKNEFLPD